MPMKFIVNQMERASQVATAEPVAVRSDGKPRVRPPAPRLTEATVQAAHAMRRDGLTWRQISEELGGTNTGLRRAVIRRYGEEAKGTLI